MTAFAKGFLVEGRDTLLSLKLILDADPPVLPPRLLSGGIPNDVVDADADGATLIRSAFLSFSSFLSSIARLSGERGSFLYFPVEAVPCKVQREGRVMVMRGKVEDVRRGGRLHVSDCEELEVIVCELLMGLCNRYYLWEDKLTIVLR